MPERERERKIRTEELKVALKEVLFEYFDEQIYKFGKLSLKALRAVVFTGAMLLLIHDGRLLNWSDVERLITIEHLSGAG